MRLSIPTTLVIFLVAIAVVNGFAVSNYWYWAMRWFDMPMHFAGGAWLAGFGIWWQYARRDVPITGFFHVWGVGLFFALGVGILWEAYEACVSFITVGHMNAIADTLSDLFFDIMGGTAVSVLVWLGAKLK